MAAMAWPHNTIDREGDSVVSRGETGEDTRVEVKHFISSSSWTSIAVEVCQEGFKSHSLGRSDCNRLRGRYRVFFLTGAPLKVLSVRLQRKSYQKVSEFTYQLALRFFREVPVKKNTLYQLKKTPCTVYMS